MNEKRANSLNTPFNKIMPKDNFPAIKLRLKKLYVLFSFLKINLIYSKLISFTSHVNEATFY